ncbi:MAG TPA: elongation factor P [Dehalococcoidales bacterium]|nr:elongation factor P [Dehalococcoidales bacterium]
MIDSGELKKGVTIELDDKLYQVISYQHIKIGRGGAIVKMKLRDIRGGHTIERTFQASEKFKLARLESRIMQYLYNDSDSYYFMDEKTFEQIPMSADQLGDTLNYLKENASVEVTSYQGKLIGVELPITVELEVAETGPGFKGDTATGGTKPAKLETGITIQVPLFINNGDMLKIDTRTGQYLERVN